MGEASTLFKMVAVLGLFFLFVGVLPGQSTPSAWQEFQTNMNGSEFPEFNNPFPNDFLRVSLTAYDSSTVEPYPYGASTVGEPFNTTDCTAIDWGLPGDLRDVSECVRAPLDNSFVTQELNLTGDPDDPFWTEPSYTFISVIFNNATAITPIPFVTRVVVRVVCKADDRILTTPIIQGVADGATERGFCSTSGEFRDIQMTWKPIDSSDTWTELLGGLSVLFIFQGPTDTLVDINYVQVDVFTETQENCAAPAGAWFPWADEIACAIGRGLQAIYNGFLFAVNGVVFAVQVVAHVLYLIALLVAGFFQMLFFLYALPGTPTWAQIVVDVFVTATLVYIIFIVVKMVRGSGEG